MTAAEGEGVLLLAALLGTAAGVALALLPGTHPYLLVGAAALPHSPLESASLPWLVGFLFGATTSWVLVSPITLVALRAPDDLSAFVTRCDRGAALSLGAGGLVGVVGIVALAPGLREGMRVIQQTMQPHVGLVLAGLAMLAVVLDPLLEAEQALSSRERLSANAMKIGVAALVFCSSGVLGLVLTWRTPLTGDAAVLGLPLALAGLFTVPSMFWSPAYAGEAGVRRPTAQALLRGGAAGLLVAALVSVLPLSAGGACGVLAKHAALTRDEHVRQVAIGAARAAFYLLVLLALVAPGATLPEANPLSALAMILPAQGWQGYWLVVAATAASGALAFTALRALLPLLARRCTRRARAAWALALAAAAFALGSWAGVLILVAATAIGTAARAFGGAPAGALGVALLPALLGELGLDERVVGWLGLP